MSYNILGLNFSHNSSACVLSKGKIKFFLEEDRLSRIKNDIFPIKLISYISKNYKINKVVVSGLKNFPFKGFNSYVFNLLLKKYFPTQPIIDLLDFHHLCHSYQAYKNSGFNECLSIVVDGSGSEFFSHEKGLFYETESIFKYPIKNNNIEVIYKDYRTNSGKNDLLTFCKVYETITYELGFKEDEAGKTMGLSSYGKPNLKIPNLYLNKKGNPKVFDLLGNVNGELKNKFKKLLINDETKSDFAYNVQIESQKIIGDLIEENIKKSNLKQICCSGGYFLNCVTNYYLTKRFPDIEFYFEPISSDAGTSIGAAKFEWDQVFPDNPNHFKKTLYLGPKYSKKQLIEGIQKYV